jgi:hypothetical protein
LFIQRSSLGGKRLRKNGLICGVLLLASLLVGTARWFHSRQLPLRIVLRDMTSSSGISWHHTDGSSGRRYIVETVSAGLATFDYDGDGWIDIYFVNGALLPGCPQNLPPPRNALYRNLGHFRFEDITELANVGDLGYGVGVTAGDYNNDGFADLYICNFGPNVLYRNNGDGTFTAVTEEAGVTAGNLVGAGASFLDIEGDGDLDLYVANYVNFSFETYKPHIVEGRHIYPGPMIYDGVQDILYRNEGDGHFMDITQEAGIIEDNVGTGMGMICADYDRDGDTDVFVLNDVAHNYFWENDGRGHFTEVGLERGLAFDAQGRYLASMGVDCADYDNDGWLDFFHTAYSEQMPALYRNSGRGFFEEVAALAIPGTSLFPNINWGCNFVDLDNDGWVDLFVANGNTQDNLEDLAAHITYRARNSVLRNLGNGKFVEITDEVGDGLAVVESSRGSAADDLDNDGRIDIVVLNARTLPTIIRNESHLPGHHWVHLTLLGTTSNREGVGSHVVLKAGGLTQTREVHSGRSYQGHCGTRLHFGIGKVSIIERLEVRWHAGKTQVFENLPANSWWIVIQDHSEALQVPLSPENRPSWKAIWGG